MLSNKYLLLFILCVIIFSCEGDEADMLSYPSIYHKSDIDVLDATVKVYTSAGEISNASIIDKFEQQDRSLYDYQIGILRDNVGSMDTIKFIDSKHVTVSL